jgi:hypothetical protein
MRVARLRSVHLNCPTRRHHHCAGPAAQCVYRGLMVLPRRALYQAPTAAGQGIIDCGETRRGIRSPAYIGSAWDTCFWAEMATMDGMGQNARAVRPRRGDNEWWTSRAYECRDTRAFVGRAAPEGAAHRSQILLEGTQPGQARGPVRPVLRGPNTRMRSLLGHLREGWVCGHRGPRSKARMVLRRSGRYI